MSRRLLVRIAFGALGFLVPFGLIVASLSLSSRAAKPSGRVPMAFRILADPQHDPEALARIEAQGEDVFPKAPDGYRWVKIDAKSDIKPDDRDIVRVKPEDRQPFLLVRVDPRDVTEKDIRHLYPTQDERGKAAIGFTFNEEGGRRFGALTRAHLPDPVSGFKYRLAIIIGDIAVSAPSINSEIREAGIIQGGSQGFTDREVRALIRLITQMMVIDVDPAGAPGPGDEARRRFRDDRFGLAVPWGVWSLLGKGPLVMEDEKIPVSEYEKLPAQFNPAGFNADDWARAARSAGAKYLVANAKGRDGFCMFDSKLTRFDVADATPFGRDPIRELADACRKHGLKLFLAYSLLDWHHPDYFPRGRTGRASGRAESGDWSKYVAYYQGQVRELCTRYGAIGGIRLEGAGDRPEADWDLEGTARLVHELQPDALLGVDEPGATRPGVDFRSSEREPTGEDADDDGSIAREVVLTLNRESRDAERLIRSLVAASGRGANLLLVVGPRPDGTLGPEVADRLQAVGAWLDRHGDSVYRTRRGPIAPGAWGASTRREKPATIYLHLFDPARPPVLPRAMLDLDARPFGSTVLLKKSLGKDGVAIEVPEKLRTPIDTVIVLTPEIMER